MVSGTLSNLPFTMISDLLPTWLGYSVTMIDVSEAENLILDNLPTAKVLSMDLDFAADYYIAENIIAERNYPPFDRITHDGIALNFSTYESGQREFEIETYAAAGAPASALSNNKNCIEVATGAPLPVGCNMIVPYELVTINESHANINTDNLKIGKCLHREGSDAKKGDQLLKIGTKIGITETTILAANGYKKVAVLSKPSIGIITTGDELVDIDAAIERHQIRRSNDITLFTSLKLNAFSDVETKWLPDNKDKIKQGLESWLLTKDVLVITGGVSKGTYDYIPQVLETLGVKKIFHGVAQRPGKPLWFGKNNDGKLVFGLPGNPASCLTCLTRYVIPALVKISGGEIGHAEMIDLNKPPTPNETLTLFLPVNKGNLVTTKTSGDFTSLQGSDGFVQVLSDYIPGQKLAYYPWRRI